MDERPLTSDLNPQLLKIISFVADMNRNAIPPMGDGLLGAPELYAYFMTPEEWDALLDEPTFRGCHPDEIEPLNLTTVFPPATYHRFDAVTLGVAIFITGEPLKRERRTGPRYQDLTA